MEKERVPPGESIFEVVWSAIVVRLTAEFVTNCALGRVELTDVARLAAVDPSSLDASGRVDLIAAWERVRAMVDGLQERALAAVVDATEDVGLDGEAARHEVGAALRLAPVTVWRRTRVAADLVGRLPGTLSELEAGNICYLQAAALADAVRGLPVEVAGVVEARVLGRAGAQTVAETRRAIERAVIAADPVAALDRHLKAARGRAVERTVLAEAMAGWWVTMPATVAAAAWAALSARARAEQGARQGAGLDVPGLDALRVDTLVAAILGTGSEVVISTGVPDPAGAGDGFRRGRATVPRCRCGGGQVAAVIVDLPTALGLGDHPGELPGYGPIPGELARAMATDRDWVRWTTDPGTRQVIDRGARTYRPSGRLTAYLGARDRVCGFPGCHHPAQGCDCDHIVTFAHHGQTITVNLGPLCRAHHNAKTHGGWRLSYHPDTGGKTWTSPLGRTYTKGTDPPLQ